MVDPKALTNSLCSDEAQLTTAATPPADTWTWWNTFRLHADFNSKIFACLEMSADVPSSQQLKRWLGEPVATLIIPAELFIRNAQNYPVLSKGHQAVVVAFLQNNAGFLIKCNANDRGLRNYADYVRHLCSKNLVQDPMKG